MRHRKIRGRLSRNLSQRSALMRSLVVSLLRHQRIKTTLAKAKVSQRLAEHLITLARNDGVAVRRKVFDALRNKEVVGLLFKEIGPRFNGRHGGYTRILRLGKTRVGDGAELAILELVEQKPKEAAKPKQEKKEKKKEVAEKPAALEVKGPVKAESQKAPAPETGEKPGVEKKPKEEKKPREEKKTLKEEEAPEKETRAKPAEAPEEKKPEEKPVEKHEEPPKKGFLGGLRTLFKKKNE